MTHDIFKNVLLHAEIQPVVDGRGTVRFHEMLARAKRNGAPLDTETFVAAVENAGAAATLHLDSLMFGQAWDALGKKPGLTLAFNISALTVGNPEWPLIVASAFRKFPERARRIAFELTETAAIGHFGRARRFSKFVREAGSMFVIDDSDARRDAPAVIERLKPAMIKISKAAIDGFAGRNSACGKLRRKAYKSNIPVVAEGVETEAQFENLKDAGVEYFQGYLFGRPSRRLSSRAARAAIPA